MKKNLSIFIIFAMLFSMFPMSVHASGTASTDFTQIIPEKSWFFNSPFGVAVDSSGNVYVADTYNHRIQKFDSSGTLLEIGRAHV